MAGYLQVTPDELIDSGQQLKAIADDLRHAHDRVKDLRSKQVGSKRIDSALNAFADHWNYGMNKMVGKVDMTGEALLAAGQQYAAVDGAVAGGAGGRVVVADWEYPGLGFDPLPGNPQVVQDLEHDARIFGQRMVDQANELRKLAWKDGWQGEAADVFAQHLKTLPLDLERCGEAFTGLANAIVSYGGAYDVAKRTTVAQLEQRAVEARQKLQAADTAFHTPVISASGGCPPAPDRKPLDDANDTLGAILREAHDFSDTFNDTPEIQQLEHTIRHTLTQYAPDEPGWNIVKHWAGNVFKLAAASSPLGLAAMAAHELINRYGEFFNSLAGFLSEASGILGILTLPAMFFPPLGEAMGVVILGLTAASAGIKTSLYVADARDHNGNVLVKGGNLIHSYVDVALSAGAVGAVAKVKEAKILARGELTTFGKEASHQFTKEAMAEAWHAPKTTVTDAIQLAGRKGAAQAILKGGVADFGSNLTVVKRVTQGGVVVGGAAPALNAEHPWRDKNAFGWRSVQKFPHESAELSDQTADLLHQEPKTPDLELRIQPTIGNPRTPTTTIGPARPGPSPVMRQEKEL